MPMSDHEPKLEWQSWQPQNLLDEYEQPEDEVIHVPGDYQSDELLQAELSRIRAQAEKKDLHKGSSRARRKERSRVMRMDLVRGKKKVLSKD